MAKWVINIDRPALGGFAPDWYLSNDYAFLGDKNQSGNMKYIDLTNPAGITQGPLHQAMTNGTQAAAVTTLVKSILDFPVTTTTSYGIGGNKLYQISDTAVTNSGAWPHTIDKGGVTGEDGEDVAYYKGALYYTYNHSGNAGDIGKYDLSATFDDDWGSTVPTGAAALQNSATEVTPHPMEVGANDVLYIANGRYVASYDGTTLIPQALDLPQNYTVVSLAWLNDRLYITANRLNVSSIAKSFGKVFIWDGTTDSWETEIELSGRGGGSIVKDGIFYQFYESNSDTGSSIARRFLGYISDNRIHNLVSFVDVLPEYNQITIYNSFLAFLSEERVYLYGKGGVGVPDRLFYYATVSYMGSFGALATPFSSLLVATNATTNYTLDKLNVNAFATTGCYWQSIYFDISGVNKNGGKIEGVKIWVDDLDTGARVDITLLDANERIIFTDFISFAKNGSARKFFYLPTNGKIADNVSIKLAFDNGSAVNNTRVRFIKIFGSTD